jgi:virulence-associated protein VagC
MAAFYQLDWEKTRLAPVGSFFSVADVIGEGNERIIAPVGQTWDSFFIDGPTVSEDFIPERASQHQADRESL